MDIMSDKLVTNEMTVQWLLSDFDFGEHTKKRIDDVFLPPRESSPCNVKGAIILETLRR